MAAVVIQSQARTFMARRRFVEAKDSAIKMQAQMRMYLAKTERERREAKVAAANKINAAARGWKGRKRAREMRSAVKIQTARRGQVARREYQRQRQAATQVQKIARGKQARDNFAKQKKAAVKVETMVRGKLAREEMKRKQSSALIIQKNVRGRKGRDEAHWLREGMRNAAAIKVQAAQRQMAARLNYQLTLRAIIRIQVNFRAYRGTYQLWVGCRDRSCTLLCVAHYNYVDGSALQVVDGQPMPHYPSQAGSKRRRRRMLF